MSDKLYLIVRHLLPGTTEWREFEEPDEGLRAYMRTEHEMRQQINAVPPAVEVVLIQGESIDRVRHSYPHYFTEGSVAARRSDLMDRLRAMVAASA